MGDDLQGNDEENCLLWRRTDSYGDEDENGKADNLKNNLHLIDSHVSVSPYVERRPI